MLSLPLLIGSFTAGVLMFLAPCTLPIVPGYLAFIAAVPRGASGRGLKSKVFFNALAYVIGFSIVFILLGTFAASIGAALGPWRYYVAQAGGLLIILFGLTMLGIFRIPFLSREFHLRLPSFLTLGRPESSFLIGVLFALGWSPCIGPLLGSILFLASVSATAGQGALLLAIFSLGLAIPFLVLALALERSQQVVAGMSRASGVLSIIGGVILVVLGLLMLTNNMGLIVQWSVGASWQDALLKYL